MVNRVLDKIETYYDIVGLATTGIGVACLFNGKSYKLLKNGSVSYSDLNNSKENGNVDLKNEIKKIYTKVKRNVNDFVSPEE